MEKKNNVWINVKDQVPDDYEPVLFVTNQRKVGAGYFDAMKKSFILNGAHGQYEYQDGEIVYWMPFPKAPEVDA